MILLSGYLSPVENMPPLLQLLAYANPLTHFIVLTKGIMLRSYGILDSAPLLLYLLLLSVVSLYATYRIFTTYKPS